MTRPQFCVDGRPLERVGLNAWTDAALMQNAGIPTVLFGPLGGSYHAPGEWVSIGETVRAAEIIEEAVTAYLGIAEN